MQVLVILGHPEKKSFNHAIAAEVIAALDNNGHKVTFHDLYQEQFDPRLDFDEISETAAFPDEIAAYCEELARAEGIVIVHPNWWGQPPALLKGWIDRVFRPGVAYRFEGDDAGDGVPIGLLKAKTAVVFNTSNTPLAREIDVFGDPLERLWKNCIFDLSGVKYFYRKMFSCVITSTPEQRKQWLKDVREIIKERFKTG
jgi:putative NADPH-quinone reductase